MRDPFELVEFVAYLIAVALVLPIIAQFRDAGHEILAVAIALFYVLPFPIYVYRLNRLIPEWLDRACLRHLKASWIIAVLAIISVVVWRIW